MSSFGRFSLVIRAATKLITDADPLDDEDLVLQHHVALSLGLKPSTSGVDTARLQRATQGARESTSGGRHQVIEGGRPLGVLSRSSAVVLADLVMSAEEDGLLLGGQIGIPERAALPDHPHAGHIGGSLRHAIHSHPLGM
jgi:hypothetical protein